MPPNEAICGNAALLISRQVIPLSVDRYAPSWVPNKARVSQTAIELIRRFSRPAFLAAQVPPKRDRVQTPELIVPARQRVSDFETSTFALRISVSGNPVPMFCQEFPESRERK